MFQCKSPTFDFPYTLNARQLEVAQNILDELKSGTRHIILDAPTGSGKSIIAGWVADQYYKFNHDKSVSEHSGRVGIITKNINLQSQYTKDFPTIGNLSGKNNYSCAVNKGGYYLDAACVIARDFSCMKRKNDTLEGVCEYLFNRTRWMDYSNVRLTNFSFMIKACSSICTGKNFNDLMIIDEFHELPMAMLEHSHLVFDYTGVKTLLSIAKNKTAIRSAIDETNKIIMKAKIYTPSLDSDRAVFGQNSAMFSSLYDYFSDEIKKLKTEAADQDRPLTSIEKAKISQFVTARNEAGEYGDMYTVITSAAKSSKFVRYNGGIKAIYPGDVAYYSIFRKGKQFVHMSATPCDIATYVKQLRLGNNYKVIKMDSEFEIHNRQVYYAPIQKIDTIGKTIVDSIDLIVNEYAGQRGLIHTASYARAEEYVKQSKYKSRMVIPTSRSEIDAAMKSTRKDLIIVSPAVSTGYDFKDDLCRFQVVMKVPYKAIGDDWMKAIYDYNRQFYFNMALTEVIQMCGRGVRNKEDYCTTYILDQRFGGVLHYQKDSIPDWFMQSIIKL